MDIINLGDRIVNTYLVRENGKTILVDTGYHEQFASFEKRLKKNNLSLEDIDYIFLTHAHDDHAGFLNEVLRKSKAILVLHENTVMQLEIGQNLFDGGCSNRQALLFCQFMKLFGKGEHKFPPLEKEFRSRCMIVSDETKDMIEGQIGAKIIMTSGHTKCSISLFFESGEFFCGDAAMNGFPSSNRVTIWIGNVKEFCDSWRTIIRLEPSAIYPTHGKPFHFNDLQKNLQKAEKRKLFILKY